MRTKHGLPFAQRPDSNEGLGRRGEGLVGFGPSRWIWDPGRIIQCKKINQGLDCSGWRLERDDHFDTTGSTGSNRTPFAASFLCGRLAFVGTSTSRAQQWLLCLGRIQGFSSKGSRRLQGFRGHYLE